MCLTIVFYVPMCFNFLDNREGAIAGIHRSCIKAPHPFRQPILM